MSNRSSTSSLSADAKEFVPTGHNFNPLPVPIYPSNAFLQPMTSPVILLPTPNVPAPFYPTAIPVFCPPAKRVSRQVKPVRVEQSTKPADPSLFQFRAEDFPTLPLQTPSGTVSINPQPLISWNTVVSTPRSASKSPRSVSCSSKTSNASSKAKPATPTSTNKKNKKNKKEKKAKPTTPTPETQPETFILDDENAFPALGQEVNLPKSKTTASTTPGLIPKSQIKPHRTYEVRLTDMFNALTTSTQTKPTSSTRPSNTTGANPLDSNPVPKRGKERERPKARKPTKLKRIITKELEENRQQRQELRIKSTSNKSTNEGDGDERSAYTTSASCTDASDDDNDDDDDDEQQPTSQSQTPFAQQLPTSNLKQQIHDGTFREYCTQLIDRQLDELCIQFLLTLKRFQDRKKQQFQSNPERARRKRRFVHGIREVTKHLRSQRLKCVFIAPDCQSIESQGGLNDAIEEILHLCKEQNLPFVFTLNRQKLGRCLNKVSRVSAIGIFDCSGADDLYKKILELSTENQRAYKEILENDETTTPSHGLNSREFFRILHRTFQQQQQPRQQIVNHIPSESLSKVLPKIPAHYAHSRQTSDTSTIYIDPQLINSMKKQHSRASSGTFDMGQKKTHHRTLSDGATGLDVVPSTTISAKHSRTPSGCSAISQIEQQDYFEQSKTILNNHHNHEELLDDSDENRLKSIHEDTEESSAQNRKRDVAKWINENQSITDRH